MLDEMVVGVFREGQRVEAQGIDSWLGEQPQVGVADANLRQIEGDQIVAEQKIGAPLGADIAAENPKAAEQWRSSRSGRNINLNLMTARNSFQEAGGFATLLRPDHADLVAEVEKAFAAVLDAQGVSFGTKSPNDYSQLLDELKLEGVVVEGSFPQISDEDRRKNATDLIVRINHLRDLLRQKVPPVIGITLGFNELDGDGS